MVLTSADVTWCKNWVKNSQYKETLFSSGLTKQQFYDILQAIEDYSLGSFSETPSDTLRAAINTAAGANPTVAQDQAIWYSWAAWRGWKNQEV